jgi:hypothetical protein
VRPEEKVVPVESKLKKLLPTISDEVEKITELSAQIAKNKAVT